MATPQARIALEGFDTTECLRWRDDSLYFSDMAFGKVHRWDGHAGDVETVAELPGRAGGIGWLPGGDMLVVLMDDAKVMRVTADGTVTLHCDLRDRVIGSANDMVVDESGYAYVGSFGFDYLSYAREHSMTDLMRPPGPPTAPVYCLSPDGEVVGSSAPLAFANGFHLDDSGRHLVVAESLGLRLTALTVDGKGGFGEPELWASLMSGWLRRAVTDGGPLGTLTRFVARATEHPMIAKHSSDPVSPDGICSGADDSIWIANALRGEVVQVAQGGQVLQRIRTSQLTLDCVIGGATGSTLYAATVAALDPEEARRLRAGRIEVIELDS
ncbi:SMP-30/gluconolactonase/LRE family protein [Gordonia jinhuaensis]|uniref:Gluconolaconase n=1 Tax=Gordonia jinhuaensis TaxID=1517702 RepID=A0A916TFN4_9ACTN|nr:SMP-30/gluconolactonase/LRE family protein [Gordonia jinhuaensis]GGB43117.1 gluconolaconase [Gordonia jinhuaensis]